MGAGITWMVISPNKPHPHLRAARLEPQLGLQQVQHLGRLRYLPQYPYLPKHIVHIAGGQLLHPINAPQHFLFQHLIPKHALYQRPSL